MIKQATTRRPTDEVLRPEPQHAAFHKRVAAELKSLLCGMIGPGTIAAAQRTIFAGAMLAVGPSPKHGKSDAIKARAKRRLAGLEIWSVTAEPGMTAIPKYGTIT
jgi:hypothetical protein